MLIVNKKRITPAQLHGCPRIKDSAGNWLVFCERHRTITAERTDQVMSALQKLDAAVNEGFAAAGFIAYEAAPGLDVALETAALDPAPCLWFGVYERVIRVPELPAAREEYRLGPWELPCTEEDYHHAIRTIRDYIAAGDTYQVNFTMPLQTTFEGDPEALFAALCRAQPTDHGAYLDTGDTAVCSASPELFFSLDGRELTCRPMKGTAARGLTYDEDRRQAERLQHSEKNRAENVMIVDMIRNDLGRIAEPGSVDVPDLFSVEKYPTVYQMTSTVSALSDASFSEIIQALFPCSSITGAPKVRTMQIIRELEPAPRGLYTGSIGYLLPGRQAKFNVAIRTPVINRKQGSAAYGVGGGIVWDSRSETELEECRTKASFLTQPPVDCNLFETLRYEPETGYFLLDYHIRRLLCSAEYLSLPITGDAVIAELQAAAPGQGAQATVVKLTLDRRGGLNVERRSAPPFNPATPWRTELATTPVDANDWTLYHKTTNRQTYLDAREHRPRADDVILWNADREVTESTIANVVAEKDKQLITPPITCGLLPGTFRAYLLDNNIVREQKLTISDLTHADKFYLVNAVRGWMPAELPVDGNRNNAST